MRISRVLIRLAVFAVAALWCLGVAVISVRALETRSVMGVQGALLDGAFSWASVQGDGLNIILEGEAPSEAARFRAISLAGTVVDSSRVIDNINVAESDIDTAPDFAIEFLRNDSGVSMIGVVPSSTDRADVLAQIRKIAGQGEVVDLLNGASYSAPEGWNKALGFALKALALLPRSKVSMSADQVSIRAISASEEQKHSWEVELGRFSPKDLPLVLDISAPRPVITPFTVRFVKNAERAWFDACSADNDEGAQRILAAARAAGAGEDAECALGLGVPSQTWPVAVSRAIGAIGALGGGTLTIADADISLVALEGTDSKLFEEVIGKLQNDLPDVFSLNADLPRALDPAGEGPPEFVAVLAEDGSVELGGRVPDALVNTAVANYAMARFGHESVAMATLAAPEGLPQGWAVRVLAAVEALSELHHGTVNVTPDTFTVRGRSGRKSARADISRMLIDKLGEGAAFTIEVIYDPVLDPIASMPKPQECVGKIKALNAASKIIFDPGSSTIASGARGTVNEIADVLKQCPELPLQIAGYTDSQGSEDMNRALSQRRAQAVVDALRLARVPTRSFEAIGFGEDNPIASNETEEGREANRRIEFTLIGGAAEAEASAEDSGASAEPASDAAAQESATPPSAPSIVPSKTPPSRAFERAPPGADTPQDSTE